MYVWVMRMKRMVSLFATIAGNAVILVLLLYGVGRAEDGSRAEGRRLLEDSLRHAVTVCYAAEGRYPESLAYLESHYGIRADKTRYAVHYEITARNLMPEITVIEK